VLIIGERINSSSKQIGEAISSNATSFIQNEVKFRLSQGPVISTSMLAAFLEKGAWDKHWGEDFFFDGDQKSI